MTSSESVEMIANRYRVLGELGRGGMGTVYRVADTLDHDRVVALKTLRSQAAVTAEARLRLKEEFRAMVRLRHHNTVQVYDYGQLDETTQFITMEVVSGRDLYSLIMGKRLELKWIYPILIQLLQALEFIHSRLFVHRDIKPANIRVRDDGVLKLMDFGLMEPLGLQADGQLRGTPQYLPPEVVRGGVINASSDLYSAGCMAYQLLTGQLPFSGKTILEEALAHLHQEVVPPRQLRPDVPERLEQIVLRLLQKNQRQRYQEATDVIADLADLAGLQIARQSLEQKKSYFNSSALIGRERELSQLEAALADTRKGAGRAIFIGAPAGVGKSRLAQELALNAKLNEFLVLGGQGLEEGMSPYEALAKALRPCVTRTPPEQLALHGPVLCRLFPELTAAGITPAAALAPVKEDERLQDTIVAWLRDITRHVPVVLLFEDLHWVDVSTLHAFNHIIRETGNERLLCLGTFRNDECPLTCPLWFTIDDGGTHYLTLSPLSLRQVMLLLQAMLRNFQITREMCEFLYDATAGNPFFVTEVLRFLAEQEVLTLRDGAWSFPAEIGDLVLPTSIEGTVMRRLGRLSPAALALAQAACVFGRRQDREALLALSGLDEETLFDCLDELGERQFLVREEAGYLFPHDRLRETLYNQLTPELRSELHQRSGEYLERTLGERASLHELAHHFDHSADRRKAYEYCLAAGKQAMQSAMVAVATEYYKAAEQALEGIDYPDKEVRQVELWCELIPLTFEPWPEVAWTISEKLVPVLEKQGNIPFACAMMKGVVATVKKLPKKTRNKVFASLANPPPYKHKARKGLARLAPAPYSSLLPTYFEMVTYRGCAYGFGGRPNDALPVFTRLFALLPFKGLPLEGALVTAQMPALNSGGKYDRIAELIPYALSLLENRDLANTVEQTALIGLLSVQNGRGYQGYRVDERACERALEECEKYGLNFFNSAVNLASVWYAWTGRHRDLSRQMDRMAQNCRKIGAPPYPWLLYFRAYQQWQLGDLATALGAVELSLRYTHLQREPWVAQTVRVLKAQIHVELGDLAAAESELAATETLARATGMGLVLIQSLIARGQLEIARGDLDAAARNLEEVVALVAEGELRNPLHHAIAARLLGDVARRRGNLDAAWTHNETAWNIVTDPEQDNLIEQGHVQRDLAEIHVAAGDLVAAQRALEQADARYAQIDNRHLRGRVLARIESLRSPGVSDAAGSLSFGVHPSEAANLAALVSGASLDLAMPRLNTREPRNTPVRVASGSEPVSAQALTAPHLSIAAGSAPVAAAPKAAPALDSAATMQGDEKLSEARVPSPARRAGRRADPAVEGTIDSSPGAIAAPLLEHREHLDAPIAPSMPIAAVERDESSIQAFLARALVVADATEASLFAVEAPARPRWLASRGRAGALPERRVRRAFIEEALGLKKVVCAVDIPDQIVVRGDSSLDAEMPAVMVLPLARDGATVGLLYLIRNDMRGSFSAADVARLGVLDASPARPAVAIDL